MLLNRHTSIAVVPALVSRGIASTGRNPDEPPLVPVLDQGDFYAVANVTGSF